MPSVKKMNNHHLQRNLRFVKLLFSSISIFSPYKAIISHADKFEPYSMNGGLVSAVAGPDYVIIASDTRLSQGYEILTRNHLSSRLWSAVPYGYIVDENDNEGCERSRSSSNNNTKSIINDDGSVRIPSLIKTSDKNNKVPEVTNKQRLKFHSPTFIASAGCASDCEALKRQMRYEINGHINWSYGLETITPSGLANVLGQTLYARRGFPFYSFCILAGISANSSDGEGHGVVHIYDAIGSHERVAVASAGTGKEMLQPILDRLFSTIATGKNRLNSDDVGQNTNEKRKDKGTMQRDGRAVLASKQRVGLKLQPPVETFVNCGVDEAVSLLVRGYRSVAEREIAVGDNVVICVIKRCNSPIDMDKSECKNDESNSQCCSLEILRYPLKQH